MTPALAAATQDPQHAMLVAGAGLILTLSVLGINIRYTQLPVDELGDWNPTTGTLHLAIDSTLEERFNVLDQFWKYMTEGPQAAPGARRVPTLQLVPPPRPAS